MNKGLKIFLIGCGTLVVLFVILIGVLIWKATQMGQRFVAEMEAVNEEVVQLNQQYPFEPAQGAVLTAGQLDQWTTVSQQIQELDTQYQAQLDAQYADEEMGIGDAFSAGQEAMRSFRDFIYDSIEILRNHQMSLDEYFWIESQILSALNSHNARQDPELDGLISDLVVSAQLPDSPESLDSPESPGMDYYNLKPVSEEQVQHTLDLLRERQDAFPVIHAGLAQGMMSEVLDAAVFEELQGVQF